MVDSDFGKRQRVFDDIANSVMIIVERDNYSWAYEMAQKNNVSVNEYISRLINSNIAIYRDKFKERFGFIDSMENLFTKEQWEYLVQHLEESALLEIWSCISFEISDLFDDVREQRIRPGIEHFFDRLKEGIEESENKPINEILDDILDEVGFFCIE